MNILERNRIKESDKAIGKICVEAKKAGKSYGQLQAERYEKQLKQEQLTEQFKDAPTIPEERPKKRHGGGRPKKEKPVGWESVARMVMKGEMSKYTAAPMLHITPPTLMRWIEELVSDSDSCSE